MSESAHTPAGRADHERGIVEAVEYRVLGPLAAAQDGTTVGLGGPRQRMVLAVLLASPNRVVSQDALIDAVWAGEPPEAAKTTLHSYVSLLRRELRGEIVREGDGYRVVVADDSLDALRFERLVTEGRRELDSDPASALATLQEALELWHGLPYGDLSGAPALMAEVSRLDELRVTAVESRVEAALAVGNHASVVGELETLVREYPYRERLRGLQMLALYRSGRQAEALRAYQRARTLLGEELGIEPSLELRDLEQRILEQDAGLDFVADTTSPSVATDHAELETGRTIRGYELREQIGEGDFGYVYRAYQPSVGREVAIKVIRPEYVNRSDFLMRFEAEAQLIAQLEHPHIVGLLDYWRDPEGAYIVMPLLRGGSLAEALRLGPWNLGAALQLLDEVGAALGYAHRRGLVHRDIKPGNILLDEEGNAYLGDFGIALRLIDPAGTPITSSLSYLPPEETRGEQLTQEADIFSLGVLAFHLFTGVYPAGRRPLPSVVDARPGLPSELDAVLRRATDDQPGNRYERVDDFLRAVRRAVGTDVVAIAETDDATAASGGVRNPYKGLRSFAETDALDFHGRDVLVDELLRAIGAHPVVAVVGPSGSGKSSVVRAGLIPALRAGGLGSKDWLVTDMFPGSYPFEELEAALMRVAVERPPECIDELISDERGLLRVTKQILPADESRLLLVIDQFEELFSAVGAEETRRLFLDSLVTIATDERSRMRVVLTMRADFFDRPLEYPQFGDLMSAGLVTVSPPTEEGLAQAIAAPARAVGVDLEAGLVGEIIRDVADQPGALPLLQYALTELFNRRQGNLLTIDAYRSTGGVAGALGRRAEELYEGLSSEGKQVARQVFLRLVAVDELSGDSRRRVRQAELKSLAVDQAALDSVLRQFGSFRLLSYDRDPVTRGPTVEVAHEALLREWDRLAGWIDAERENLLVQRRIGATAREWADSGGDPGFLLRGGRLDQAERWAQSTDIAPSREESELLDASRELRDSETRTAKRRRRVLIGLLAGGLSVAIMLAGLALWQRGLAQDEARRGGVYGLAGASEAALDEDPELAMLLALKSAEVSEDAGDPVTPATLTALQGAVQNSRLESVIEDGSWGVAVSSDGSLLATLAADSESGSDVIVSDPVTGEKLRTLTGPLAASVEFSPTGTLLAVGHGSDADGNDGSITVWDAATGDEVARLPGGDAWPVPHWSPDGTLLIAVGHGAGSDRPVNVWRSPSMDQVNSFLIPGNSTSERFLDPVTLAVARPGDDRVTFYDLTTGDEVEDLDIDDIPYDDAAGLAIGVDPVGGRLVLVGSDTQVWDLESKSLLWSSARTELPEVDPARGWVATYGTGGVITVLDLEDGSEIMTLAGHPGAVNDVAFDPTRERLYSAPFAGGTRIWDITPAGPVGSGVIPIDSGQNISSSPGPVKVVVSPSGGEMAVTTGGGKITRYASGSGAILGSVDGAMNWFLPAPVSPDWRLLAVMPDIVPGTGEPLPEASIEHMTTGEPVDQLPPCVWPKGFSSDGAMLVLDGVEPTSLLPQCSPERLAADIDVRSRVTDVLTGEVLLDLGERGLVGNALFNPPGVFEADRYLAVNVSFHQVEIHDMVTGEMVAEIYFEEEVEIPLSIAFDPKGQYLATGGQNGHAWVVDVKALVAGASVEEAMVMYEEVGSGGVGHVALGPNGVLATAAHDPNVRLWDIHSGQVLHELAKTPEVPRPVAFGPDGELLYVDGNMEQGHVVRTFLLDADRMIDLAESRATRTLTAEECERYLPDSNLVSCP